MQNMSCACVGVRKNVFANVFIILFDGYIPTHKVISSPKYRLLLTPNPKTISLHLVTFASCKFPFIKSCCNLSLQSLPLFSVVTQFTGIWEPEQIDIYLI
jgi:hypothetical protein